MLKVTESFNMSLCYFEDENIQSLRRMCVSGFWDMQQTLVLRKGKTLLLFLASVSLPRFPSSFDQFLSLPPEIHCGALQIHVSLSTLLRLLAWKGEVLYLQTFLNTLYNHQYQIHWKQKINLPLRFSIFKTQGTLIFF